MKVEGIHQMIPVTGIAGNGNEGASVERKIQALQRDLNQLEQKQELTGEEQKEKQKLEKQIADLKRELAQIQAEKKNKKEEESDLKKPLKEEGKGQGVDEFV